MDKSALTTAHANTVSPNAHHQSCMPAKSNSMRCSRLINFFFGRWPSSKGLILAHHMVMRSDPVLSEIWPYTAGYR